ncbi:hypothetical protein Y1Q_0013759 [Alligator mississippiensis]|uniref:Uncharacterized protein n=1 Tax=Alligator mississippiensis TaxID=8496 RepID=A0A151MMB3_ALLMI|nr:hypothetical protein Y1Q_0013759 [Alligator mississippiensis]
MPANSAYSRDCKVYSCRLQASHVAKKRKEKATSADRSKCDRKCSNRKATHLEADLSLSPSDASRRCIFIYFLINITG